MLLGEASSLIITSIEGHVWRNQSPAEKEKDMRAGGRDRVIAWNDTGTS
jgi:hypothetical protein